MTEPKGSNYTGAIIVPAFNEEHRIAPLLPVLSDAARDYGYLVVISCNGCKDRTAELARATPNLEVLEFEWGSKPRALNEAERFVGDVFPRLYVDADLRTTPESLRLMMDALRVDEPRAVRPFETYLPHGAPWIVRAYHEARYLRPSSRWWLEHHIEGHHIYGTNKAGRARFETFPEEGQMMEDAFFDRMFDQDQKIAVEGATVEVPLPQTVGELFRAQVRIDQGNWQLTSWLEAHRPDRLSAEAGMPRPPMSKLASLRYRLGGGATHETWRPRAVLAVVSANVLNRLAELRARRLVRAGHQVPWR